MPVRYPEEYIYTSVVLTSVSANPGQRVMLNYAGNACEVGDLVRCLPDSPKPVSPKHDSPKLGFRVWG